MPEGNLTYHYYSTGKVETIQSSNPNGVNVSYTYDGLNRLSTVVDNRLSSNNTTSYTYDNASNVALITYPNMTQDSFTYDPLNRLTAMNSGTASYSYQLGLTGNRTQATESTGRTLNWSYDGIYRLTNEAISSDPEQVNGSVAYGLDPVGNRLTQGSSITGLNSGSFGYNADDEVSTETYDNNGNTLTTGGKTFAYDSENHVTSMTQGSTVVTIKYDAFGNRVSKTVNGVTTQYLVDNLNPTGYSQVLDELSGTTAARTYTYGLQRISEDQIVNSAWVLSFYGYDGAESVRQLTNSMGQITDSFEYDAFGNKINSTGATPNNYLYRGEQYDPDLGLYYLRARYMNPATGRFLSRDPEDGITNDPASLHKYIYAGGDPVNAYDPTGRSAGAAVRGGSGEEYLGLIAAVVIAVQYSANNAGRNSSSVVSSVRMLGENLNCSYHRTACMLTGLASKRGGKWGQRRCDMCYEACIRNEGIWPTDIRTTGRPLDCEYSLYPSE